MTPRIETAEVLSFRLKVPRAELEALPVALRPAGLKLAVSTDGTDVLLSVVEGDSLLRFRDIGRELVLAEIVVQHDLRGLFFQKVLGPLMVRFAGDLHCRLTWNSAERNSHGDFAEVKIARGSTTYPGLAATPFASPQLGGEGMEGSADAGEVEEAPPSADEVEVRKLLDKAKAHWAEYQKLKKLKGE